MAEIQTFTKTGRAIRVPQRSTPLKPTPVAKLIRARLNQNEGVTGRGVVVTNPAYTGQRRKRTASLGQGGVGQRGRAEDVPGTI